MAKAVITKLPPPPPPPPEVMVTLTLSTGEAESLMRLLGLRYGLDKAGSPGDNCCQVYHALYDAGIRPDSLWHWQVKSRSGDGAWQWVAK